MPGAGTAFYTRIVCATLWISAGTSPERQAGCGLQPVAYYLGSGRGVRQPLLLMPRRSIVAFSAEKLSRAKRVYCEVFM